MIKLSKFFLVFLFSIPSCAQASFAEGLERGSRAGENFARSYQNAQIAELERQLIREKVKLERLKLKLAHGNDSANKLYNLEKNSDFIYYKTLRALSGNPIE